MVRLTGVEKILAGVLLYAASLVATAYLFHGFGQDRAQAQCSEDRVTAVEAAIAEERSARAEEARLRRAAEEIADAQEKKHKVAAVRAARAERSVVGLRDEIARLNSRPAPEPADTAGFAREAAIARELLGACAEAYRVVARDADELSNQVSGLLRFDAEVRTAK